MKEQQPTISQKEMVYKIFSMFPRRIRDLPTRAAQLEFAREIYPELSFVSFQKYAQTLDLREPQKAAGGRLKFFKKGDPIDKKIHAKLAEINYNLSNMRQDTLERRLK